ncbi:MAG: lysine biosynthesis protein LysX [Calditrichae bacterium]|nr:lysine biosynthesis protein LysX [Calditrichia bacterium]
MNSKVKIGLLHSLIRRDEKLLIDEINGRDDAELVMIDDREISFSLKKSQTTEADIILERCINHYRALHALQLFEDSGILCINKSTVASICGSKFETSLMLKQHNVPQPEVRIAFTEKSALEAIEDMGYPVVMKPAVGSWGRLIAKVSTREAAEAILEHKTTLGTYHHSVFYIQQYVEKNGRDIRSFVVGDECIAAVYRTSEHWITNTARGAVATNCPISDELAEISKAAAKAVGGGILAIDVFETEGGLMVNEVNYTMEFKNSIKPTGVNIPEKIVDYVVQCGRENLNG